jgi:hypothetical protein
MPAGRGRISTPRGRPGNPDPDPARCWVGIISTGAGDMKAKTHRTIYEIVALVAFVVIVFAAGYALPLVLR